MIPSEHLSSCHHKLAQQVKQYLIWGSQILINNNQE